MSDGGNMPGAPEPPRRYDGGRYQLDQLQPGPGGPRRDDEFEANLKNVQKYAKIASICALVSLVVGGVLLSMVAVVVGLLGHQKAKAYVMGDIAHRSTWEQAVRSCRMSVAFGVLALALNAVSLIVLYPMVMESLGSGDLFGMTGVTASGSSGTGSIWG